MRYVYYINLEQKLLTKIIISSMIRGQIIYIKRFSCIIKMVIGVLIIDQILFSLQNVLNLTFISKQRKMVGRLIILTLASDFVDKES